MKDFKIKVNNEKTYMVRAKDFNQAVKTLHSKLRDFDDTKKNINVVREFITNNGGKFSKSKDADAILDFIYKKTGVKNADYGDVLYIIRNYTNVKVEDNAVSDSISKYNSEDAIRTNGFVKIKEDGDWTSYKYTGNNFDDAVFKIHQYNPSLIAFVSNGNRTITVRNKYLKDSSITDTDMKTAEEIIKKYGGNPVGNVMGLQKTRFVGQDEIKNQHDFAIDLDKAGYKFYLINGRYRISPKDSAIDDNSPKYSKGQKFQTSAGIHEIIGYDPVRADVNTNRIEYSYRLKTPNGTYTNIPDWQLEESVKQGRYKLIDSNINDADPVKVEKIIRKEKSALGITYYIFQTKSSSGYTIYYQVTDRTYHGEPTYSGGGIISLSLKSANDTLDHNLLADKLIAKYGEKEGTKRYLRGENDSAINDKLSTSDANSLVEAYIDKYKYTHSNLPYVNKPEIKIFNSPEEFRDKFLSSYRGYSIYAGGLLNYNGYVVKLFTSSKDGKIESPSADNIFTIFPTTSMKDSANNIKNRKSYTIKVGDKQYKIFAESEEEAVDKYIKSKRQ